ncbi:MAG: hypothetical protein K2I81_04100 [Alphaproteobacteria bacterium]|nr:hypothetical protein [Alphaproteobacteria bacterium]
MPKENGPFFAALFATGVVHGAYLDCAECYRCVQYSGPSCVRCVYDENYCAIEEFECDSGKEWSQEKQKCVCESQDFAIECAPWSYYENEDVCDCVPSVCLSGTYPTGLSGCAFCQEPDFTLSSCTVESDSMHATSGQLLGGRNGCYIPAGCEAVDDTGTFELIADCSYELPGLESL